MTENFNSNIQLVRDYLSALQAGEVGDSLSRFFTPDAVQTELPNKLKPHSQDSDLASLIARSIQAIRN